MSELEAAVREFDRVGLVGNADDGDPPCYCDMCKATRRLRAVLDAAVDE